MVFLCGRPGCGRESSATLQIDAPGSTITLVDPRVSRDGVPLCPHHADATTPPVGWTMNDLRSVNRTLAPVRSIGPKTGEIVSAPPRPRVPGNPLFQDSRPLELRTESPASHPTTAATDSLGTDSLGTDSRAAERGSGQAGPSSNGRTDRSVGADSPSALSFPVSQEVRAMPLSASARAAALSSGSADPDQLRAAGLSSEADPDALEAHGAKAPASRPSKRREVVEEGENDDDKFPWHFSFNHDEPQELQAKSPLLARAFRSSVG